MVARSARSEGLPHLPKIMLAHRRFGSLLSRFLTPARLNLPLVGFALLAPSVALAGPKDAAATKLANQAMQTDYVGTQFKKAEQKLKKAIQLCGSSNCAYDVVGRLHRDLATVYIGGMNQTAKGKAELKLALEANPDLQLDPALTTAELKTAFIAAGGKTPKSEDDKDEDEDKPEAKPAKKTEDCEPGTEGCDAEAPKQEEAPAASGKGHKNWISLSFSQDFLVYSSTNDVCATFGPTFYPEAPQYSCFQSGSQYGYSQGQNIVAGVGNHVAGGVGVSTSSILLGFDHVVGSNFSLGARLGFAFGGSPETNSGAKFLPLRAEVRGNYWFGTDPFENDGVRPYVVLSAGVAELDGHVSVEYYQNAVTQDQKGTLDAWRRTGKTFAGLGFGLMIPFAGSSGIVPELRVKEMLGASSLAFDASIGYALGF